MEHRRAGSPKRAPGRALALAIIAGSFVLSAATATRAANSSPDFSAWFSGAGGMLAAAQEFDSKPRPILVYFYTDWCGYCRQFERELLSTRDVGDYLDGILAVRINPESGPENAALGRRYGVRGYPGLFVHSAESRSISQIDRVDVVDGRPVMKTPSAFIDTVKQAGAR